MQDAVSDSPSFVRPGTPTRPGRATVPSLIVAVLVAGSCAAGSPTAPASGGTHLAEDRWGGEGALLVTTSERADIMFSCANGASSSAILVDAHGRFDVAGTYTARSGGAPPPPDVKPAAPQNVRYAGQVSGETVTLTVQFPDPKQNLGPFALKRGSEGHVPQCP